MFLKMVSVAGSLVVVQKKSILRLHGLVVCTVNVLFCIYKTGIQLYYAIFLFVQPLPAQPYYGL